MKGRLGKFGFILLALALCLSITGAAFAHWSQTLYIDGEVNTGTFCIGFSVQESDDPCVEECDPGAIDDQDRLDPGYTKNVAGCWCELLVPKGEHLGMPIYEKMRIVVCNAYPCYENTVMFWLANGGTVPGDIGSTKIVSLGGVALADPIELPKGTVVDVDLDGDGEFDVNMRFDGPADQQIDPCQELDYSLWMHFKDGTDPTTGEPTGLKQNTQYTFDIEINTVQWNLVP